MFWFLFGLWVIVGMKGLIYIKDTEGTASLEFVVFFLVCIGGVFIMLYGDKVRAFINWIYGGDK